jgi:subtilisin family serine protease
VFLIFLIIPSNLIQGGTRQLIINENEMGWHLDRIDITGAWKITTGSPDIIVAVIDSGIDFSHPELVHAQWINTDEKPDNDIDDDHNGYVDDRFGWDFVKNDSVPGPDGFQLINGHATFVAGMLCAEMDGKGVVGVAPDVTVMNVQIWDNNLYGESAKLALAIRYAVDNGADVINFSLDRFTNMSALQEAVKYAYQNNVIMVGATGGYHPMDGGGREEIAFPAAYDEVIVVGATDYSDELADYNNWGEKLEIMAPGGDYGDDMTLWLNSTWTPSGYSQLVGTSHAVPQITGVVALMKSLNSSITLEQAREFLHTTARDLGAPGRDIYYGYGMVNATAAIMEAAKIAEPRKTEISLVSLFFALIANLIAYQIFRKKLKRA